MGVLGQIVRLQVQSESLKVGSAPRRRYDPAPLRSVPALTLTVDGVEGWTAEGDAVPDVHNRTHPASKNRDGTNGISLGFTSHYRTMRERFGDHLSDGIAGENILVAPVEPGATIDADDLRDGVLIEAANGHLVRLDDVIVAAPCVEFARYALRLGDDARSDLAVTEAVRFLHDGIRGYYATYRGAPIRIGSGAWVLIP